MVSAKKNTLLIASGCMVFLFACCYLLISIYNRHCADDFDAIRDVNLYGIFGSVKHCYMSWEGSFTQGIVNYPMSQLFKHSVSLFWYNAISLVCLALSCYALTAHICKKQLNLTGAPVVLLSGSVLATLFYTSPAVSEVWFWLVGSASYLWPLTFLFLALYFILKREENGYNLLLACIFSFLFAGSRLNYPVIIGFFYFLILLNDYRRTKKINGKLLLPFIFLGIGLVVYVIAPGNFVRRGYAEPGISMAPLAVITHLVKGSFRIILYNNLFQLPYMAVMLSPVLFIAVSSNEAIPEKYKTLNLKRTLLRLLLLYLGAMFVHTVIMYFALGDAGGSPRTRLLLHLVFCVLFACFYFLLGLRYREKLVNKFTMFFTLFVAGCLLFVYKILHEVPVNKTYARAYDRQTEMIFAAKQNFSKHPIETLFLPPLPPPQRPIYVDPTFGEFRRIGALTYFFSIPNGSIHNSVIAKRRPKDKDAVIDVYREDHINIKLENTYQLPFRIDLDTLSHE